MFDSEIDAALKKITGKDLVGKEEWRAQVPDSDCLSKRSSYVGRLWAASVQSGKLSHQATVRKTALFPVRGGGPSVVQSPPSRLVARVGHVDGTISDLADFHSSTGSAQIVHPYSRIPRKSGELPAP